MYQTRLATKNDMPRVLELINELAVFEKEPDAVEVTVADLEKDGFCEHPKFTCFVVEVEDIIEGFNAANDLSVSITQEIHVFEYVNCFAVFCDYGTGSANNWLDRVWIK